MKYCTKCVLPDTHETIKFDSDGVCNICRQSEVKHENIDWEERHQILLDIVEQHRDKGEYDCIVPFSGGKDSTFQLWYIVTKLRLKPLVVRYNHWGLRSHVEKNNTRTFKKLGVDVIDFKANWKVVKATMLEALKKTGDFCWHCHTGVYANTMRMAVRFNIPLIIWGESTSEYRAYYKSEELEELDEQLFNQMITLGITADDMAEVMKGKFERRDFLPYTFPTKEELNELHVKPIFLGNYIKWNTKENVRIIKEELGWEGTQVEGIPPEYDYEKIECRYQGVRDYCKYIKRGHGRTNHLACIDIRNGDLTREEGMALSLKYDGKRPASLDYFLDLMEITEEEFIAYLRDNEEYDWGFDRQKIKRGEPLYDMDEWDTFK